MIPEYIVVTKRENELDFHICTHVYDAEDFMKKVRDDGDLVFVGVYKLKRGKFRKRKPL